MIGHDMSFDRRNKKIGIAEANCDKNIDNKTMDEYGVENGYDFKENENIGKRKFIDFFLNEKKLGVYIFITFVLFFVIIYLILVLVNLKKRKRNPWLWFIKSDIDKDESFIPIRYDVNDINETQNDKGKNIDMIYLNKDDGRDGFKNSKYSKIST